MDLDELDRLTTEFEVAVDGLGEAARRAGQDDPAQPLLIRGPSDPLHLRLAQVLALQEEIVDLLRPGAGS